MDHITLRAARVNAGLTQKQAAEILGVTPQTIIHYERGTRRISADDFFTLCGHYGFILTDYFPITVPGTIVKDAMDIPGERARAQ